MSNCETCKEKKAPATVSYVVYETELARSERHIKRLWKSLVAVAIIAIVLIVANNIGWIVYESQFETITYEKDGEGINNVNYGDQGDLNNGTESQNQTQEESQ